MPPIFALTDLARRRLAVHAAVSGIAENWKTELDL
jgi:hypothetical protein